MKWVVTLNKKAKKQFMKLLSQRIKAALYALIAEIKDKGPVFRGNWPNYSIFGKDRHHCHLTKRYPTYVAVWQVVDKEIRIMEIKYAGTHENAS